MPANDKPTLIWTELDFKKKGKQIGVLHLPYSVTRSAYGMIDIPLAVIGNGDGPTVLLMAGNHGDEYEGQVTLVRLIQEIEPRDVKGRIIVMPAANLPAAMAGARVSPLDAGNLNRAFPGHPETTPTWQIAHYIDRVLVPMAEAWLDLHSGGSSLAYLPFAAFYQTGHNKKLDARTEGIMQAFAAPRSIRVTAAPDPRLAAAAAHHRKIPYLGGEFGGGGSVNPDGVAMTRNGVLRVLKHLGVLKDIGRFKVPAATETRLMELGGQDYYVYAPETGLFEPAARLGDVVKKGQLAGHVHFIDNPGRKGIPVHFKRAGFLICQRHFGRVQPGDCVAHLATDVR
ncbi:MAG: succinylglutamate desuccinylase/aspartoacylase family protein [Proteobacteria bacterium]|nr:succinylglutamate desuccinylase/aspartoacylase family protein [Pseudomonadota bacterium]MBI3496177.1 succinylglutamate desuccinylase/aspartoacylase family protein [Pseudomonadota bacterium]